MLPPFGRNHAMKRMLENYNMEFEDIKQNLTEIRRRVAAKTLTDDQARELAKETREILFTLNKKVIELNPIDSRASLLKVRDEQ